MQVYRITKRKYAYDLSGTGAYLNGGRWNTSGTYVVYTAGSSSLAILETLAHVKKGVKPEDFVLVTIEIPDSKIKDIDNFIKLPRQWNKQPPYNTKTMAICQETFFRENVVLKVPSAVNNKEFNYLINPLHPDVNSVKVVKVESFNFDNRFVKF